MITDIDYGALKEFSREYLEIIGCSAPMKAINTWASDRGLTQADRDDLVRRYQRDPDDRSRDLRSAVNRLAGIDED